MPPVIHFVVPSGSPFYGKLACDRRVSAIGYPAAQEPGDVTCQRCRRTDDYKEAAS